MTVYRVTLPFPPSVNNLFAHGTVKGKTRRFPTKQYKAWRKSAWALIKQAKIPLLSGHVAVRLTLTPPNAGRRDVDNYSKAILDALVDSGVLSDDSQVTKLLSAWDHDCADACAFVEVGASAAEGAPMTPAEKREIKRLRDSGARLLAPNASTPRALRSLVERGLVRELPGLFEGFPQGYVLAD